MNYVEYINENKDTSRPIHTDGEMDDITVEVAMVYNGLPWNVKSFPNNIP